MNLYEFKINLNLGAVVVQIVHYIEVRGAYGQSYKGQYQ